MHGRKLCSLSGDYGFICDILSCAADYSERGETSGRPCVGRVVQTRVLGQARRTRRLRPGTLYVNDVTK